MGVYSSYLAATFTSGAKAADEGDACDVDLTVDLLFPECLYSVHVSAS